MAKITRREFLKLAGFGAAALGLARMPRAAAAARRPNILVIMSDEHNASVTGCYGNAIARTPILDALAARGVVFESAYTNSPLCVPCRLSFTAGKFVSRVSGWNNSCKLPTDDYPSIPRVMNAAGYDSVLCGKMHYDADCRYGFREIGGNMNNSRMTGTGGRMPLDRVTPHAPLSARFKEFYTAESSGIIAHDRKVVAGAAEFLRGRRAAHDKPFFLLCGFLAPHFPLIVPEKYFRNFEGKIPMPKIPAGHLDSLPLNYKALRVGFGNTDVPPETVKKGRELYYGLTQWMDEQAGEILKALEESGEADNTVIIYTTDHGENMGEHGLWWKNAMYENAARVPLIVSWPARWKGGQRRAQACSLVDVVATIAELGGGEIPADWNGASLCAWLDDPAAKWKDLAISEYYAHNIVSGYVMLRTGPWKYVYHTKPTPQGKSERELYNLTDDPGEFNNLAGKEQFQTLIAELHARLVKETGEDPDATEQRCRAECAKGYANVPAGAKKGKDQGKGKGQGKGKKSQGI